MELALESLKERKEPARIILVKPDFYDVIDVKNPYMKGEIVDHAKARNQWQSLVEVYQSYVGQNAVLEEVVTLDAGKDLEDMVFCANQSLPFQDKFGNNHVLLSNMKHDSRKKEVPYFEEFYKKRNYNIHQIDASILLEGMGDCIFHPFKQLLWMGHGYRTDIKTAELLNAKMDIPVIPLKLVSPYFYHLDTCFVPLNERAVVLCKEAFDEESFEKIQSIFEEVIEISRADAIATFALNTHCIYNKNQSVALVPKGSNSMIEILKSFHYKIHEMDTSEFIKGGGSVFCMKMMFH
jgi:N-dimethylarginine dimethylaminohydrolase